MGVRLAFTFELDYDRKGLCDFWSGESQVACGCMRKDPDGGPTWTGPLCAKCAELRSWYESYMAAD